MSRPSHAADLHEHTDGELVELVRDPAASERAFAQLWQRHSGAATTIARRYADVADPDDLVAESFARVLSTIRRGGGPSGSFRPYLAATIGNVARRWAVQHRDDDSDWLDQLPDSRTEESALARDVDRQLAYAAFQRLPERWQQALWYGEVEGLGPSEMAPILGMKPNAVAQLLYRARAGLRTAWVEAHVRHEQLPEACARARSVLGRTIAGSGRATERRLLDAHLVECADCRRVRRELRSVLPGLAGALLPAVLLPHLNPAPATAVSLSATVVVAGSARELVVGAVPALLVAATSVTLLAGMSGLQADAPLTAEGGIPAVVAVDGASPADRGQGAQPGSPSAPAALLEPPSSPVEMGPAPDAGTTAPQPAPEPAPEPIPVPEAPTIATAIGPAVWPGTEVEGFGTPGATVLVDDGRGTQIGSAEVGSDGTWVVVVGSFSPTVTRWEFRERSVDGVSSAPTVVEGLAPAPVTSTPPLVVVPNTPAEIEGIAFPGARILVSDTPVDCGTWCGPSHAGEIVSDGAGAFRYAPDTTWPGDRLVTFTYVDEWGTSTGSAQYSFRVTPWPD